MSPVNSPEVKIVVDKDEAQELPPGWIVEVRKRKSGSRTKVDRLYTDPVTGYIFRSLRDAQRYLKTGVVGRLAIKPKKNECVDLANCDQMEETEERSESKEQMSESLRSKRPLDKSKRLASINIDSPPPSPPEPKTRQATGLVGIKIDSRSPSPQVSKSCQATPLGGTEVVPLSPYQPEPKTQAKHLSGIIDNPSPASLPQPKTRRATRQAGIKVDSPPPSPPDSRNSRQAKRVRPVTLAAPKVKDKKIAGEKITDKHNENAGRDNNRNRNQETNEKQVTTKEHNKEIEMGPFTLLPSEHQAQPTVVPPVALEKQELPVVTPTVSNPIPQNGYGYGGETKSHSSNNFSMNDLWTDPSIEFAVKTLTDATPFGDLTKPENISPSPLEVPLEELWTDPCIEFAVKTLIGAIPVGEDDYLQHRPASSINPRAPHDFNRPNVGMSYRQTDVLSKHFETGQIKQQNLVVPTYGNHGLQKSGDKVAGSSGQCSRSRFFQ